ncbi:MAG: hypothetical protein ACLS37_08335 [Alistipes sp.]
MAAFCFSYGAYILAAAATSSRLTAAP